MLVFLLIGNTLSLVPIIGAIVRFIKAFKPFAVLARTLGILSQLAYGFAIVA